MGTQLFRASANAAIKAQQLQAGHGQCQAPVNRVKSPNGFGRKRMPRAFNNVWTDASQVPVASSGIQVRPATRGRIDFSGRNRAGQPARDHAQAAFNRRPSSVRRAASTRPAMSKQALNSCAAVLIRQAMAQLSAHRHLAKRELWRQRQHRCSWPGPSPWIEQTYGRKQINKFSNCSTNLRA